MTDTELADGLARLESQFMRPVVYRTDAWEVQADHGSTYIVPAELVGTSPDADQLQTYTEGKIDLDDDGQPIATLHRGIYLARLSAPGYMDCTDWSLHTTERDANAYLVETYDDGE